MYLGLLLGGILVLAGITFSVRWNEKIMTLAGLLIGFMVFMICVFITSPGAPDFRQAKYVATVDSEMKDIYFNEYTRNSPNEVVISSYYAYKFDWINHYEYYKTPITIRVPDPENSPLVIKTRIPNNPYVLTK